MRIIDSIPHPFTNSLTNCHCCFFHLFLFRYTSPFDFSYALSRSTGKSRSSNWHRGGYWRIALIASLFSWEKASVLLHMFDFIASIDHDSHYIPSYLRTHHLLFTTATLRWFCFKREAKQQDSRRNFSSGWQW